MTEKKYTAEQLDIKLNEAWNAGWREANKMRERTKYLSMFLPADPDAIPWIIEWRPTDEEGAAWGPGGRIWAKTAEEAIEAFKHPINSWQICNNPPEILSVAPDSELQDYIANTLAGHAEYLQAKHYADLAAESGEL